MKENNRVQKVEKDISPPNICDFFLFSLDLERERERERKRERVVRLVLLSKAHISQPFDTPPLFPSWITKTQKLTNADQVKR